MPADALPVPRATPHAGAVRYRRAYVDTLGRPLTGRVAITGTTRREVGQTVVIPSAVMVDLVGGELDVSLPPDTYELTAALRNVDGERFAETTTITLEEAP